MKKYLSKNLPLVLAAVLQVAPLMKTIFLEAQALAPSSWAIVFRLGTGAVALFGFHAVSSASSIAISPVNATNGVPYVGTVTYSGSHAGEVSSMSITNLCMNVARSLAPGLTITYSSVNKASVSGTPTKVGTFPFTIRTWDGGCSSGDNDSKSASLIVGASGGGNVAPAMVAAPQNTVAQVGAGVLLSAGASGTPLPRYYWYRGIPSPSTLVATNSTFTITNVALTQAGLYTVTASNIAGQVSATAYLSVCRTAGSNTLAYNYTNYVPVSNSIVMTSFITNTPSGSNTYKWQYNHVDVTSFATNGTNFTLPASQVIASKSGIYSVVFNSVVGANTIVNQQGYDSNWAFGTPPTVNTSPQNTNVFVGSNATFSVTTSVSQNPYGTNVPLGFLWYFNNTNLVSFQNIIGTNLTATLNLTNIQASNGGNYTVVITNYWGAITSAPALLTVASGTAPTVSSQPVSKTALVGQIITLNAVATGTTPLFYQWKKSLNSISNGGVYSGATSNVLTLTGLQIANTGDYSVMITNALGSTTSSNATVTVLSSPTVRLSASGGNLQLNATTATGLTYVVQTAAGLSNSIVWTPIATNLVPANGTILFTNSTTNLQRFFRLFFP